MDNTKEVRFDVYCKTCEHYNKSEADDPCFDCLDQGWNTNSHKPIFYKEDEKKKADSHSSNDIHGK